MTDKYAPLQRHLIRITIIYLDMKEKVKKKCVEWRKNETSKKLKKVKEKLNYKTFVLVFFTIINWHVLLDKNTLEEVKYHKDTGRMNSWHQTCLWKNSDTTPKSVI